MGGIQQSDVNSTFENKLEDVTDMTRGKPCLKIMDHNHPFKQRFFQLHEQISSTVEPSSTAEQEVLAKVYPQMAQEGLMNKRTLLERSPELVARYVRGVLHKTMAVPGQSKIKFIHMLFFTKGSYCLDASVFAVL